MKLPSAGTRRQLYLLAALAVVLILAVVKWGGKGPSEVPGPALPRGGGRSGIEDERPAVRPRVRGPKEKNIAPEEVPFVTKEMLEAPRARRAGESGRNIFDFRVPTVPPPPPPTPAPPPPPAPGNGAFVGPLPPPAPTPTPVPPEINFKFIGTFGPRDRPIAALVSGNNLLNARAGDVVFDRFILRNVGYESVDIGYVGYPPTVTKRLAITP